MTHSNWIVSLLQPHDMKGNMATERRASKEINSQRNNFNDSFEHGHWLNSSRLMSMAAAYISMILFLFRSLIHVRRKFSSIVHMAALHQAGRFSLSAWKFIKIFIFFVSQKYRVDGSRAANHNYMSDIRSLMHSHLKWNWSLFHSGSF